MIFRKWQSYPIFITNLKSDQYMYILNLYRSRMLAHMSKSLNKYILFVIINFIYYWSPRQKKLSSIGISSGNGGSSNSKISPMLLISGTLSKSASKQKISNINWNTCTNLCRHVTVWHTQPWHKFHTSFWQVLDKFDGSHDKNFLLPTWPLPIFRRCDWLFGINSHQTCQKPVKNLYKTYAGWPQTVIALWFIITDQLFRSYIQYINT